MAKASIRDRLIRLENRRRFLDWFMWHRLCVTLTLEELEIYASGGGLPDPIPNRSSNVDTLDRKSLLKLWEENESEFGGRNHEELVFYTENGFWPEQKGRLYYSMQNGKLSVEWRNEPSSKPSRQERQTEEERT